MEAQAHDNIRELDPFGFMVGHSSAIRPLGGDQRSLDPRYVCHTPYVEFSPGRVIFSIRFAGLRASFGELRVNINAFIPGSGRDAIFVTSSRLQLADRAAAERGLTLAINCVPGATYAIYGYCTEATDAFAEGLTIVAEQFPLGEGSAEPQQLLPTQLGTVAIDAPSRLVGDEAPSFRDPVSQPMTAEQLEEPEYRQWAAKLRNAPGDEAAGWTLAFIAQVLDRYGMLRPGARGIGWGEAGRPLAAIFAGAGCETLLAAPLADLHAAEGTWTSVACSTQGGAPAPDGSEAGAMISFADMAADQRGFDFLWTIGSAGEAHAAGKGADPLIEQMMVLRPGGYGVHMFDLAGPGGDGGEEALPRAAVERLAVMLIARGFSVAQLNFGGGTIGGAVPFGLVVRKD